MFTIMEDDKKKLSKAEMEKAVDELRQWLEENLPNARRDDHYILRFFEGSKCRMDQAKSKLECDYNFRRKTPEWFANRDPEGKDVKDVISSGIAVYSDIRDEKGRRLLFLRPFYHDISLPADSYFKAQTMCSDEAMEDDPSIARDGLIVIVDLDRVTLTQCMKKIMLTKKMMHWWLNTLPMRVKELHMLNFPGYVTYFLNILKKFLKEKMRNRIIIHKEIGDLKNYVDPKFLPEEYGGTVGSMTDLTDSYVEKVFGKRQYFLQYKF